MLVCQRVDHASHASSGGVPDFDQHMYSTVHHSSKHSKHLGNQEDQTLAEAQAASKPKAARRGHLWHPFQATLWELRKLSNQGMVSHL